MRYKHVLFDLDGTLTDPYEGIADSVTYALGKFGIFDKRKEFLFQFIGPPLEESFAEFAKLKKDDARKAALYYREYYGKQGIYDCKLYGGVEEVLTKLNTSGKDCFVATSKLETFALRNLEYFTIDGYFRGIAGSNHDGSLAKKGDIIKSLIEKYRLDTSRALMIGDRKYDISGARENGIDSIGVTYGYGTKDELREAGAVYFAESPLGLLDIICPR